MCIMEIDYWLTTAHHPPPQANGLVSDLTKF